MISACIVGKTNEPYIRNCFASVRDIVDEVVYLDTGSTDKTVEIAQEYADKILHIEQHGRNWGEWRTLLIQNASQEWILTIDTDEIATNELREQLRSYLKALPEEAGSVRFKRADLIYDLNHYLTSPKSDPYLSHPSLYKRGGSKWVNKVHETYVGTGKRVDWDIIGVVHYNLLMAERLRAKTHPRYWDKTKYSDEFILKQWKELWPGVVVKELPPSVTWKEVAKYGTAFN